MTNLNSLGHCETYKFWQEVKTALDKALDGVSTFLFPQIVTDEGKDVFDLEWENLNKITINVCCPNMVKTQVALWYVGFSPCPAQWLVCIPFLNLLNGDLYLNKLHWIQYRNSRWNPIWYDKHHNLFLPTICYYKSYSNSWESGLVSYAVCNS